MGEQHPRSLLGSFCTNVTDLHFCTRHIRNLYGLSRHATAIGLMMPRRAALSLHITKCTFLQLLVLHAYIHHCVAWHTLCAIKLPRRIRPICERRCCRHQCTAALCATILHVMAKKREQSCCHAIIYHRSSDPFFSSFRNSMGAAAVKRVLNR
jgi:hypothetical protein